MEKLIDLLNKYEKERWTNRVCYWVDIWIVMSEWITYRFGYFISKEFWFIQWLVKHFYLNVTKIDSRIALSDFNTTDRMLMALAISEDPIALLVDCLK